MIRRPPRSPLFPYPPLFRSVVPGSRVVVPLRRRQVVGVVAAMDVLPPDPGVAARPIAAAPDAEPALSAALLELGRWISRRSEEHTSELQSRPHLVCRLLLEK